MLFLSNSFHARFRNGYQKHSGHLVNEEQTWHILQPNERRILRTRNVQAMSKCEKEDDTPHAFRLTNSNQMDLKHRKFQQV